MVGGPLLAAGAVIITLVLIETAVWQVSAACCGAPAELGDAGPGRLCCCLRPENRWGGRQKETKKQIEEARLLLMIKRHKLPLLIPGMLPIPAQNEIEL